MERPLGGTTTQAAGGISATEALPKVPGVVVAFANGAPRSRIFRWEGTPLVLGRLELAEDDVLDSMISRKHVRLDLDGPGFSVEDLGSRNGTFLRGSRITPKTAVPAGTAIRVGGAVLVLVDDAGPFLRHGLGVKDAVVAGPAFRHALETIAHSRRSGVLKSLLISGESGSGKEIAAKVFHDAGAISGAPFVAVNCATIPKDLAERLLFGSRRGAFSGATDAPGHVQAAHGGTLFLDEVAELLPEVQTKLLRMLETREVLRLGATRPEHVDVHVCAATWRDLRAEAAAGRFREDLYFRIGQPEIRLPPLRARIEEVPWHTRQVLEDSGATGLEVSAAFIEACANRAWPGNVRELRGEVRRVAAAAIAEGVKTLSAEALSPTAGKPIERGEAPPSARIPADEVAAALSAEAGNVLGAARRLGVHRNKIRRWLERYGVDPRTFKKMGLRP